MTARGTWKARERKVAREFGTERTPLSGGGSRHTRSDSLHEKIYMEQKLRQVHSAVTLWRDTKKKADAEKKVPMCVLVEKGKQGYWLLCHSTDFKKIVEEYIKVLGK